MPEYGVLNLNAVIGDSQKELVLLDSKEIGDQLARLSDTSLAELAITPDVEDYGFPPDAKERLM